MISSVSDDKKKTINDHTGHNDSQRIHLCREQRLVCATQNGAFSAGLTFSRTLSATTKVRRNSFSPIKYVTGFAKLTVPKPGVGLAENRQHDHSNTIKLSTNDRMMMDQIIDCVELGQSCKPFCCSMYSIQRVPNQLQGVFLQLPARHQNAEGAVSGCSPPTQ